MQPNLVMPVHVFVVDEIFFFSIKHEKDFFESYRMFGFFFFAFVNGAHLFLPHLMPIFLLRRFSR